MDRREKKVIEMEEERHNNQRLMDFQALDISHLTTLATSDKEKQCLVF